MCKTELRDIPTGSKLYPPNRLATCNNARLLGKSKGHLYQQSAPHIKIQSDCGGSPLAAWRASRCLTVWGFCSQTHTPPQTKASLRLIRYFIYSLTPQIFNPLAFGTLDEFSFTAPWSIRIWF